MDVRHDFKGDRIFRWDGKLGTLLRYTDAADFGLLGMSVDYPNKFGNHPRLSDPVTLYLFGKKVPVGVTVWRDTGAKWHFKH